MDKENWEKLLDWLQREDVSRNSVSRPPINMIDKRHDLYLYLKNGVELNRILASLLNNDQILREIHYTKLPSVFHNNIRLFRKVVHKEWKFDIFRKYGNTSLQREDHFEDVIKELGELSAKIERTHKVVSFKPKKSLMDNFRMSLRKDYNQEGEDVCYQRNSNQSEDYVNYEMIFPSEQFTSLHKCIEEFLGFQNVYKEKVLELENKSKDCKDDLLNRLFFPSFKLKDLIEFHKDLLKDFKILTVSYSELYNVFLKHKDGFLMYSEIILYAKKAQRFLNNNELTHTDTQKELLRLNNTGSNNLNTLVAMFTEHLPRYPIFMEAIMKYSNEPSLKNIHTSAENSLLLMKDIVNYVEKYIEDSDLMEEAELLLKNIQRRPKLPSLVQLGYLTGDYSIKRMMDVKGIPVKVNNMKMALFSKGILFYEVLDHGATRHYKVIKPFSRIGDHTYLYIESTRQIKIDGYKKNVNNLEFSYKIELSSSENMEIVVETLQEIGKITSDMSQIEREDFENLVCHSEYLDENMLTVPKTCILCSKLITGRLQEYVKHINEENMVYHLECLITSPDWKQQSSSEEKNNLDKIAESEEEFVCADAMTGTEAEKILEKTVGGTFLVRNSRKGGYVVSSKSSRQDIEHGKGSYRHHSVLEKRFNGKTYYYLTEGQGFTTLLDLIHHNQEELSFVFPIHSNEATNGYDPALDNFLPSKSVEKSRCRPRIKYEDCFHGDITMRSQANNLLMDQIPHTFLVRYSNRETCPVVSVKAVGDGEISHLKVWRNEQDMFHFANKSQYFSTEGELLNYYNDVEATKNVFLRYPYLNAEAKERGNIPTDIDTENEGDGAKENEEVEDGFEFPFYHPTLSRKDSEDLLRSHCAGSFLLRKSSDNQFYLSCWFEDEVAHYKITRDQNGYTTAKIPGVHRTLKIIVEAIQKKYRGKIMYPVLNLKD